MQLPGIWVQCTPWHSHTSGSLPSCIYQLGWGPWGSLYAWGAAANLGQHQDHPMKSQGLYWVP